MEWGMPMGFKFFIALRSSRELMALLPSKVIFPTFTFGPSFTTKVRATAAGGMGRTSERTVAN